MEDRVLGSKSSRKKTEKEVDKHQTKNVKISWDDEIALSPQKMFSSLRPRNTRPSFRKVELNDNDLERIVGKRVKVYWSGSRKWFTGHVSSYDNANKLHRILYDDGDKEDLNLKKERFELEVMNGEVFRFCSKGPNHEKNESTDGGEVSGEMNKTGSLNISDVGPVKKPSRMNRKAKSKSAKKVKSKLHKKKATEANADDMAGEMEVGVCSKNSKDEVNGDGSLVYCGDGLGGEKKGRGISEMLNGKKKSTTEEHSSTGCTDCQKPENLGVPPDEEGVEKVSKKRRRGAGGEIAQALLTSPEKNLSSSKLRPRKSIPSFQKVKLHEQDFEKIIGKRVKVYWSGSRRWFVGRIKSYDTEKRLHRILYNDGDKEDLNLEEESFELEVMNFEAFSLCSKLGSTREKKQNSVGGEVSKKVKKDASLNTVDVGPAKKRSSLTRKIKSKSAKKARFNLHEEKATEENVEEMEAAVHPKNSEVQVTSNDIRLVHHGFDLGGQKKGRGLSGTNKETLEESSSIGDCPKPDNLVKNGDATEEEYVKKPPKNRKKGADGEIAVSPEKTLSTSKLRPRRLVPSFQKVELDEKDFERIVGKKVKVYWSGSRKWFVGRIQSYDNEKKLHKILYDDGDKEELDLKAERFELELMSDEAFNLCSILGSYLEKKAMSSDDGKASKEMKKNGSPDVIRVEPIKKNARIDHEQVPQPANKGKHQLRGGKDVEKKTEDMVRDMEVQVHSGNNKDQVTSSKNTYWRVYGEVSNEMMENCSKAAENGGYELHQGKGTEERTADTIKDLKIGAKSENEDQVKSSESTYWNMYGAEV